MPGRIRIIGEILKLKLSKGGTLLRIRKGSEHIDVFIHQDSLPVDCYNDLAHLEIGATIVCLCCKKANVFICNHITLICKPAVDSSFKPVHVERLLAYSQLLNEIRTWFHNKHYVEVRLPTIHYGRNVKESFPVEFKGHPARLSAANALFLNIMALQLGKAFTLQRAFRDEPKFSFRHLAEFDLLEAGCIGMTLDESMDILEDLVRSMASILVQPTEHQLVKKRHSVWLKQPFRRIDYDVLAQRYDIDAKDGMDKYELRIAQEGPVFVKYPPLSKASWSARHESKERSCSFTLLLPCVGEVAEGAEECTDRDYLQAKFHALQLDQQLGWYAHFQRYPKSCLGTIGMGIERLAMWILGVRHIRDVVPFFRTSGFSEIPNTTKLTTRNKN